MVREGINGLQQHVSSEQIQPLIKVENLTRIFESGKNSVTAVDNVSFEISKGEIVSIIGESGSGKTTLARLILKLDNPNSGKIIFKGQDITFIKKRSRLLEHWRQVQAVFQDPFSSFNDFFSVYKILSNTYKIQRKNPAEEDRKKEIIEALEQVGLNPGDILYKKIYELSGGQRQRLMIARILLIKPEVLIADEPTSMIDASLRASILNLILDLRERLNMTIIFITHDIGLAYYTSDRLLIMNKGKIVEEGKADDIILSPKDSYTKKLLEDVPVITRKWEL